MFDIREIFDASRHSDTGRDGTPPAGWSPASLLRLVREFYRQPFAWLVLVATDLALVYGGGAAMFWYHSYLLGEGGPAISPYLHWFMDSTLGLVGLTPMLFVILPLAARAAWDAAPARPLDPSPTEEDVVLRTVRPITFVAVSGILFALATAPGPIVHDHFVGRGTYLANEITKMWGDGRALGPHHTLTPITAILTQEAFGLPLYTAILGALLIIGGLTVRALNRKAAPEREPDLVGSNRA
jgi:hypothetical protein